MNVTRDAIIEAVRGFRVSDGWTGATTIGDDDAEQIAGLILGIATSGDLPATSDMPGRRPDEYATLTFVVRKQPGDAPAVDWEWEQAVAAAGGDECVFYAVRDGITQIAVAQGVDQGLFDDEN